jgi:hypothetical protein
MTFRMLPKPEKKVPSVSGPESASQNSLKLETADTDPSRSMQSGTKLSIKIKRTELTGSGSSGGPSKEIESVLPRAELIARRCHVCRGPHEHDVNLALLSGEPVRSIGQRYGYSKSSLLRHFHRCIPQSLVMARQSKKIGEAEFVTAELCKMVRNTKHIMALAEKAGDTRTSLMAIRELRGLYEVLSRPVAQSNPAAQVNILVAPELLALREEILKAIEPFPEARAAVSRALTAAANSRANSRKSSKVQSMRDDEQES